MNQLSVILSLVAGISSFVSPCVFPLIPSYLSVIGGNLATEGGDSAVSRKALWWRTVSFVLGFSVVFVVLGVLFSAFGLLLGAIANIINVVSAIIILLLAAHLLFNVRSFLQYEKKLFRTQAVRGNIGAFLMGVAFSAGWSPCIGPVLTSILLLAANSNSVVTGAFYLLVYSIGLGIPFLLIGNAVPYSTVQRLFRTHGKKIKIGSGIILLAMGILILFGRLQYLNSWLVRSGMLLEGWATAHPTPSKAVSLCVLAIVALLPIGIKVVRLLRSGTTRPATATTAHHTDERHSNLRHQPPSPTSVAYSSTSATMVAPLSSDTTPPVAHNSPVPPNTSLPPNVPKSPTHSTAPTPLTARLRSTLGTVFRRNIATALYLLAMATLSVLVAIEQINLLTLIGGWLQFQGL